MDNADINSIVNRISTLLDNNQEKKISFELREKNKFIGITSQTISKILFDKLYFVHAFDLRILTLIALALELENKNISGDIAELGVYQGNFAKIMHILFPSRHFYLLDTFSGFNQKQFEDDDQRYSFTGPAANGKRFNNTNIDLVLKNINGNNKYIHPVQGFFPDSAEYLEDKKFAFVNLDADLYQPMKDGIEFFYPRMVTSGYIMIHDFNHPVYKGCHDAICEYLIQNNIAYFPCPDYSYSIIITKM